MKEYYEKARELIEALYEPDVTYDGDNKVIKLFYDVKGLYLSEELKELLPEGTAIFIDDEWHMGGTIKVRWFDIIFDWNISGLENTVKDLEHLIDILAKCLEKIDTIKTELVYHWF